MTRSSQLNYRYYQHYIEGLPRGADFRVLDYGCGEGQMVRLLRESGLDCVGCDVYYGGGTAHEAPHLKELMEAGLVKAVPEEGPLPYPAGHFDVVLSNQVFEHVRDVGATLDRIRPLLKPGGHILAHFPSREVIREGHIGIPFSHWFKPGSRLRRGYTLLLRRLGMGYFKRPGETPAEWTDRCLHWIDNYCFYVPVAELDQVMGSRFQVTHNEMQYMLFRSSDRPLLNAMIRLPGLRGLWCLVFRRLAFMAVVLHPATTAGSRR